MDQAAQIDRFAELASRIDPAFSEILASGWSAVPLILETLQARPIAWGPAALLAITGIDPSPANARGDSEATRQAWLTWGGEQGYFPDDEASPLDEEAEARNLADVASRAPSGDQLDAINAGNLPINGVDWDADPAELVARHPDPAR